MKKRLSIFALILVLIVALGLPAWADTTAITKTSGSGTFGTFNQYATVGTSGHQETYEVLDDSTAQSVQWGLGKNSTFSSANQTVDVDGLTFTLNGTVGTAATSAQVTVSGTPEKAGTKTVYLFAAKTADSALSATNCFSYKIDVTVAETTLKITAIANASGADTTVSGTTISVPFNTEKKFGVSFTVKGTGAFASGTQQVSFAFDDANEMKSFLGWSAAPSITTAALSSGTMTGTISATAIGSTATWGECTFTVTASATVQSGGETLSDSKTYTIKYTSTESPQIEFQKPAGTAVTGDDVTNIGAAYDTDNKCFFVGQDVTKFGDQQADSTLNFRITTLKANPEVTFEVKPAGSGIELNIPSTISWTANNTGNGLTQYADFSLTGTVAKAGTYTMKITAKDDVNSTSTSYEFTVKDIPELPTIASAKKVMTWGSAFNLEFTIKNVDAVEVLDDTSFTTNYKGRNVGDVTEVPTGNIKGSDLTTSKNFGGTVTVGTVSNRQATVTVAGTWKPGKTPTTSTLIAASDGASATFTIMALGGAKDKAGSVWKAFPVTLTLKSVAPTITSDTLELTYNKATAAASAKVVATAEGSGHLTWDLTTLNGALPDGLTAIQADQAATGTTRQLKIHGTPRNITSASGVTVPITVKNGYDANGTDIGSATGNLKIIITSSHSAPALASSSPKLPSGYADTADKAFTEIDTAKTGSNGTAGTAYSFTNPTISTTRDPAAKIGEVILFAEPGPLTWTAKNLPENVELVADKNDSRYASLHFKDAPETGTYSGKGFSAATTIKTSTSGSKTTYSSPYTITIENPYTSTKTTTLNGDLVVWEKPEVSTSSMKAVTVGKDYSETLKFTNTPTAYVVTIKDNDGTSAAEQTVTINAGEKGTYTATGGSSKLTWDPSTATLSGQLDRIPLVNQSATQDFSGFKFSITPQNYAGSATAASDFYVEVKGVKPKLDNAVITLENNGSETITTSAGTPAITLSAVIAKAAAQKLFGSSITDDITLGATADTNTGLSFTPNTTDGSGTIKYTGGTNYAFKGLPVTVTAENRAGDATKVYKVTVEGDDPEWSKTAGETFTDNVAKVLAGKEITPTVFKADVTSPYEITTSPKDGETKNGLTIAVDQTAKTVTITGTPTPDNKETKTQFTLTATNTSTKQKAQQKITIQALAAPTITSTPEKLSKEVQLGKKVSIKPAAKGSKTITWTIPTSSATQEADLPSGLTFSPTNGSITGTPTSATAASGSQTEYEAKSITLQAQNADLKSYADNNDLTWPEVTFTLGVKGAKTKVTTKNVTIKKNETTRKDIYIETTPKWSDSSVNNGMSFAGDGLPDGITLDATNGKLTITDGSLIATKGTTANITVTNVGTEAKGKVKFIINDPEPEIADFTIDDIDAQEKAKVTSTTTVALEDGNFTGDTKIKWAIKTAPRRAQAKIKGSGSSATLTITVPKGVYNSDKTDSTPIPQTVVITATNTKTKEFDEEEVSFNINPCVQSDTATAEDATFDAVADKTADAKAEEKAATGEGEVKFGKTRTAPTAAQLGAVQKVLGDGYVIAAVLPEIEVTADGQYDFEVDLDEKVAEGAELVWFAFPESGKETEDDEIVDFYTKAGEDTKVVPEDHVLVVSPWLNAEVKYEPVIAVKVDAAEAEAVDAESVKEAAEEQAAE